MRGDEFLRRLRKLGRRRNVVVKLDASHGKGSHARIYFGNRRTTIPDLRRELKKGLLYGMCKDLGVDPDEL